MIILKSNPLKLKKIPNLKITTMKPEIFPEIQIPTGDINVLIGLGILTGIAYLWKRSSGKPSRGRHLYLTAVLVNINGTIYMGIVDRLDPKGYWLQILYMTNTNVTGVYGYLRGEFTFILIKYENSMTYWEAVTHLYQAIGMARSNYSVISRFHFREIWTVRFPIPRRLWWNYIHNKYKLNIETIRTFPIKILPSETPGDDLLIGGLYINMIPFCKLSNWTI